MSMSCCLKSKQVLQPSLLCARHTTLLLPGTSFQRPVTDVICTLSAKSSRPKSVSSSICSSVSSSSTCGCGQTDSVTAATEWRLEAVQRLW